MKSYILFHKPYGVLSQFTAQDGHGTLADFGPFPQDVYAAGRLDADSEGLLFLTNDAEVNHRLTDPKYEHERTYRAQVEGIPDAADLEEMKNGLLIGGKRTKPAKARVVPSDPSFAERIVPIRYRKNIPTTWIEITLTEGRNRQVRKMCAAIGHPALRLIRTSIAFLHLNDLKSGMQRSLDEKEVLKLKAIIAPGRSIQAPIEPVHSRF